MQAFTRREGALHDLSQGERIQLVLPNSQCDEWSQDLTTHSRCSSYPAVKSGLLFCWLRVQRQASRSDDDAIDSQLAAIQQTMFSLLGERWSCLLIVLVTLVGAFGLPADSTGQSCTHGLLAS